MFVLSNFDGFGQHIRRTNNFNSYKDRCNEFGYAVNLSYLKFEDVYSPQLQLRYMRSISDFFSMGVGYAGIFNDQYRSILNLDFSFEPFYQLNVSLKPGVILQNKSGTTTTYYLFGLGANYKYELSEDLFIGPMVELDVVQNETIYQAGFYMGIVF
jgi:hypothetical protein